MTYGDNMVSIGEGDDGIVVVEAVGEIDASSAPELQGVLLSVFGDGHDRVVLDLSGVTFMDSSGIGSVVAAYAEARERRARFVVACGEGHAARRIRIMGLDSLLDTVDSCDEARARIVAD